MNDNIDTKRAALFRMVEERKARGEYVPIEEMPPHDVE